MKTAEQRKVSMADVEMAFEETLARSPVAGQIKPGDSLHMAFFGFFIAGYNKGLGEATAALTEVNAALDAVNKALGAQPKP